MADSILSNHFQDHLLRPNPAEPGCRANAGEMLTMASGMSAQEIGQLISWKNWRHRLIGQSLGAMANYEAFPSDLLVSMESPTGWNASATAAALAVACKRRGRGLIADDFSKCRRTDWRGEMGDAIDAAIAYVETGVVTEFESNGGPSFHCHVAYHEWLWDSDRAQWK